MQRRSVASILTDHSPLHVSPVQFGGDPTGRADSTAALNVC
jgi:hypothetical protein